MSEYFLNEFTFQMPEGLKDKTHHIFALSDDGPSAFNVVVSRNPIDAEETLVSYGTRLQKELSLALTGFRVLSDQEITLDDEPAIELRFRWLADGRLMQQTLVSVFYQGESGPRLVLQIAATTTGGEQDTWDPAFQKMLQTLSFRRKEPVVKPPLTPVVQFPATY